MQDKGVKDVDVVLVLTIKSNEDFTEAIVMVEGCDYGMAGEQWAEQICYINMLKEDWEKDKEEFRKHQDFLSKTEERLSKKSGQRNAEASTVSRE